MAETKTLKFTATPGMKGYQPNWTDGTIGEVEVGEAAKIVKDFPNNFSYANAVEAPPDNRMEPPPFSVKDETKIGDTDVQDIPGLTTAHIEALQAAGIHTVEGLAEVEIGELKEIEGVGPKAIDILIEYCKPETSEDDDE